MNEEKENPNSEEQIRVLAVRQALKQLIDQCQRELHLLAKDRYVRTGILGHCPMAFANVQEALTTIIWSYERRVHEALECAQIDEQIL